MNASNSESSTESNSLSANASLQVNRRLNNQGRNITFRGTFSYGDNDSEQFSESLTRYFDTAAGKSDDERKQYITSPTQNYDYTAELTYNEPVAKATFCSSGISFNTNIVKVTEVRIVCFPMLIKDKTGFGTMVTDYLKVTKAIRI